MVDHRTTNGIQALKLMRPRTEPSMRIGVIAAKTNWKYAGVEVGKWNGGPVVISGMAAWPCSLLALRIAPGLPQMLAKNPCDVPRMCMGSPNAILKPNRTHAISTSANATNDNIIA